MTRRAGLLVPALLFLVWEVAAVARWFAAGASVARSWEAAVADPMAFLFLTDGMMFAAIGIAWMGVDLRKRGATAGRCAAWVSAGIVVGSPVLLAYLAYRPSSDQIRSEGR